MQKINSFFILTAIALLFTFSFISAQGLSVVGGSNFNISKNINNNEQIIISLQNQESFSFYNITLENNNFINMSKIQEIPAGQTVNVTATIIGNTDINEQVKIIGEYYKSDIGQSNQSYEIAVDFTDKISDCSKTITEGDTVTWKSTVNGEIKMINANNNNEITSIPTLGNYSSVQLDVGDLNYFFRFQGVKFTDTCSLHIQSNEGYVTDPDYNAFINLNVKINYPETNISTAFLENSYSLKPSETQEGIFTIKNFGSGVAKIKVSGEWFNVEPSEFDLEPGITKTFSYKIKPLVKYTNDTNKSYTKELKIEGNFVTITQDFNIFVDYEELSNEDNPLGNCAGLSAIECIIQEFNAYCEENPHDLSCVDSNTVGGGDSSQYDFNVTLNNDAFWEWLEGEALNTLETRDYQNIQKETLLNINQTISELDNRSKSDSERLDDLEKSLKDSQNTTLIALIIILVLIALGIIGLIIRTKLKDKKVKTLKDLFTGKLRS